MDNKQLTSFLTASLSLKEGELSVQSEVVDYYEIVTAENGVYVFPSDASYHLTLIVKEGVQVTLQEPQDGKRYARSIELLVQEGAQVVYQVSESSSLPIYQFFKVSIACHASLAIEIYQKEEAKNVMGYECALQGVRASVSYKGRVFSQGSSDHRLFFHQMHVASDTVSNVEVKTVAQDTSTYRYEGTITIQRQALRSVAHQEHKTLIISKQAQVVSIPNLEVHTHQVQCGHGSAIAHLDSDHLFYLASRGISQEWAEYLIVNGFLYENI